MMIAITFLATACVYFVGLAIIAAVHDSGDYNPTELQIMLLLFWPIALVPFLLLSITYYPLTYILKHIKDRKEESK